VFIATLAVPSTAMTVHDRSVLRTLVNGDIIPSISSGIASTQIPESEAGLCR
jgi:hypothetical protein